MSSEDRIYLYPQSSCECLNCTKDKYKFPKGVPTNLSVRDCCVSNYYDCDNRRLLGTPVQPEDLPNNIQLINPQAYSESYAPNFNKVDCQCPGCPDCPHDTYASWDPRLFNAARVQYITLNRPPLYSTVKLKDIYNKDLEGYGQGYRTYSDINAGQLLYYTNQARQNAYYSPLFDQKSKVAKVIYKDPMGAMKPEYRRLIEHPNPATENPDCDYSPYCLSWIQDSQNFRNDILARQMSKINEQRWEPRWSKPN